MTSGYTPKQWSVALVTPIYKKGARNDPKNYRPISVLPVFARLFASVMREKLDKYIQESDLLSYSQIGNRKGYRTADHIATLLTLIQSKKKKKRPFHMVFFDLKNAFDTVDHATLIKRLGTLGVNHSLVRVIASMYSDARFQLKMSEGVASGTHQITNGVRQGCPLSPLLFSLYIDPLTTVLRDAFDSNTYVENEMVNNLLYCDDLVIFGESAQELQKGLDKVAEFCQTNGLIINTDKTKMISCNSAQQAQQKLILYGQTIDSVETWKYLGFHMNVKGNADTHAIEISKRCGHPIFLLRRLASTNAVKYQQLTRIVTALVDSIVLYASEAWGAFLPWNFGSWDRSLFERVNFKSCKSLLQVSPSTDNIGTRTEVGRLPLLYNIQTRSIRYWSSISKRPDSIIARIVRDPEYRNVGIMDKVSCDIMKNCCQGSVATAIRTHRSNFISSFSEYWRHRAENSGKLKHFYYTFKTSLGSEKYLSDIQDPRLRQTLAKFRLGDHKLAVETLRYVRPKVAYENRKCPLCEAEVENEIHLLISCPWAGYGDTRNSFEQSMSELVNNFTTLNSNDKAVYLMIQENKEISEMVASYVERLLTIRKQKLH